MQNKIVDVWKGEIVRVPWSEYIEYSGGVWKDHFVDKTKLLLVIESASNNGNFLAKDSKGGLYHFNTMNVLSVVKSNR